MGIPDGVIAGATSSPQLTQHISLQKESFTMHVSKLVQLAEAVLNNTKIVDTYFQEHNLPTPSFDANGPDDFHISADAEYVEHARIKVLEAGMELVDLLQGPMAFLRPVANGISLQAVSRWDIATKVPIDGELSYTELAKKCNIDVTDMRRIMRYVIAHNRLFCEPRADFVGHSLASRKLAQEPLLREGLWLLAEQFFTTAPYTVQALEKWKDQEPNHTAFNMAMNTELDSYDYMTSQPEMARRFSLAMTSYARFTSRPTTTPRMKLLKGYPWASLGQCSVVDVGGSRGTDAINICKSFPNLTFIVQDLESMIQGAEIVVPSELCDRISFMAYSFFTPQTVVADVYIIKQCFHNWPDHYCIRILQNQIPALRPGARLIIFDSVVPPPGTLSLMNEKMVRAFDIMMLTNSSKGREREEQDWINILKQADERFTVKRMESFNTTGDFGPCSGVIEVVWEI